jgi:hypothetical protein
MSAYLSVLFGSAFARCGLPDLIPSLEPARWTGQGALRPISSELR